MTAKGWTYLGDELHVTVLDTIVDHLDIVASTLVTNPVTARLAIRLGSDGLEDVLDVWPGLLVTTGHDGRTITGTFFTTRDTSTNESNALLAQVLSTAVGVRVVGVAAIDDDVARVAVRQELLDEVIHSRTSHDEQHHTTRTLELGTELLDGVSTDDGLA
jgi:hypothetical protein